MNNMDTKIINKAKYTPRCHFIVQHIFKCPLDSQEKANNKNKIKDTFCHRLIDAPYSLFFVAQDSVPIDSQFSNNECKCQNCTRDYWKTDNLEYIGNVIHCKWGCHDNLGWRVEPVAKWSWQAHGRGKCVFKFNPHKSWFSSLFGSSNRHVNQVTDGKVINSKRKYNDTYEIEGEFHHGYPMYESNVLLKYIDGTIYNGEFVNGKEAFKCKITWSDGSIFSGCVPAINPDRTALECHGVFIPSQDAYLYSKCSIFGTPICLSPYLPYLFLGGLISEVRNIIWSYTMANVALKFADKNNIGMPPDILYVQYV